MKCLQSGPATIDEFCACSEKNIPCHRKFYQVRLTCDTPRCDTANAIAYVYGARTITATVVLLSNSAVTDLKVFVLV